MPRRGRSSPMRAPTRPAPRPTVPAHRPPVQPAPMAAQPKQPGMFAQMATTAAGVAVGSAIGHTLGAAMSGGGGQEAAPQEQAPQQYQQEAPQQYQQQACQYELKQFLDCAQNQGDISICQGFNEALRQCKVQHGL